MFPPVEAQPVAFEDAGELGSCMLQASQEIVLAEGAYLGGALRQRSHELGATEPGTQVPLLCWMGPSPENISKDLHPAWDRSLDNPSGVLSVPFLAVLISLPCGECLTGTESTLCPGGSVSQPPSLLHVDIRPSLLSMGTKLTLPQKSLDSTFQGVMFFCSGMRLAM